MKDETLELEPKKKDKRCKITVCIVSVVAIFMVYLIGIIVAVVGKIIKNLCVTFY